MAEKPQNEVGHVAVKLRWGTVHYSTIDETLSGRTLDGEPFRIHSVGLEQLNDWISGNFIQNCFPSMSADDREILISGCSPGYFDRMFKDQ